MEETAKKGNGLAVAGFVMGILGVLFLFIPLLNVVGWIFAALALIFGLIGCFGNKKNKGLGIAAVAMAVIFLLVYYLYWVPKYNKVTKALGEFATEVVKEADQKTQEAVEEAAAKIDEAAEAVEEAAKEN